MPTLFPLLLSPPSPLPLLPSLTPSLSHSHSLSLFHPPLADHSGTLYRQTSEGGTWRVRFYVLNAGILYEYSSGKLSHASQLHRIVNLAGCVAQKIERERKGVALFKIKIPGKKRPFFFSSETEEEAGKWLRAIQEAIKLATETLGPLGRRLPRATPCCAPACLSCPPCLAFLPRLSMHRVCVLPSLGPAAHDPACPPPCLGPSQAATAPTRRAAICTTRACCACQVFACSTRLQRPLAAPTFAPAPPCALGAVRPHGPPRAPHAACDTRP